MSVEVVLAAKKDMDAILSLVKDYESYDVEFAKRYYDIYFEKGQITEKDEVYVAKIGVEITGVIGFCRDYFTTEYSYWLGWFVVHADYRGKEKYGVAEKLYQKVQSELVKRKIKKLFVSTEDTNARAKSFYAKNGFRTDAVLRDYYDKKEDQLILSKVLPQR